MPNILHWIRNLASATLPSEILAIGGNIEQLAETSVVELDNEVEQRALKKRTTAISKSIREANLEDPAEVARLLSEISKLIHELSQVVEALDMALQKIELAAVRAELVGLKKKFAQMDRRLQKTKAKIEASVA
jgi:hypothetical protein